MPFERPVRTPRSSPIFGSMPYSNVQTGASMTPSKLMNSWTWISPMTLPPLAICVRSMRATNGTLRKSTRRTSWHVGARPGRRVRSVDMDERPIQDHIEDLVSEEQRLWSSAAAGGLAPADHERLEAIKAELDQYWALLARRRLDPDAPEVQPDVPDPNNDLDGPDPEPPHLEHGVHGDGPAPDPDIPSEIP